jgi:urease accessory protein
MPAADMLTGATPMIEEAGLYRLMTWLSPAYPIGAFSCSHGLEYAVETGLVRDRARLVAWIETVLEAGAGWSDALLLAEAWRAAEARDLEKLVQTAVLAAAWRGTAELALESESQGQAFMATTVAAWPHPMLESLAKAETGVALAVAVGAACALHEIALPAALRAYLQGLAMNLVSAGQKLIPLGQTEAQRAIAALEACVLRVAGLAAPARIEDAGTAAPILDWCSMRHETQYTRLFRT